jgi:HEAT repeat protein
VKTLEQLFDAERTVRRLHDELAARPREELLGILGPATGKALEEKNDDEAALRLVRIAGLLGEHEGAKVVDLLIDVLASDHPEARHAAGAEIEELAFDRFKEVAEATERALKRLPAGSPALPELPYVLAQIPEPGVAKLLGQFLKHADPDAVAAAIEGLMEIGDPGAARLLEPLVKDDRTVELADDGAGSSEVTIGELATQAIGLLRGEDEPPQAAPPTATKTKPSGTT